MKLKSILVALLVVAAAQAQSNVKNLSKDATANYLLANITRVNYSFHELHKGSFATSVYTMNDSKATPKGHFEGTDGVLSSLLVTVVPDGDAYTQSRLYKIEGLEAPRVVEIKEGQFPAFILVVESGPQKKRTVEEYRLEGIGKK